jgi:hypothetical protein
MHLQNKFARSTGLAKAVPVLKKAAYCFGGLRLTAMRLRISTKVARVFNTPTLPIIFHIQSNNFHYMPLQGAYNHVK